MPRGIATPARLDVYERPRARVFAGSSDAPGGGGEVLLTKLGSFLGEVVSRATESAAHAAGHEVETLRAWAHEAAATGAASAVHGLAAFLGAHGTQCVESMAILAQLWLADQARRRAIAARPRLDAAPDARLDAKDRPRPETEAPAHPASPEEPLETGPIDLAQLRLRSRSAVAGFRSAIETGTPSQGWQDLGRNDLRRYRAAAEQRVRLGDLSGAEKCITGARKLAFDLHLSPPDLRDLKAELRSAWEKEAERHARAGNSIEVKRCVERADKLARELGEPTVRARNGFVAGYLTALRPTERLPRRQRPGPPEGF